MKIIWLFSIFLLASSDIGASLERPRIQSRDSDGQLFHDCEDDSSRHDSMMVPTGSPVSTPSPASTNLSIDHVIQTLSPDDKKNLALDWIAAASPDELLKIDRIRELVAQRTEAITHELASYQASAQHVKYTDLQLIQRERDLRILWEKEQNILVQRRVILVMGAFGAGLLSGSGLMSNLGSRVIKRFNRLLFR